MRYFTILVLVLGIYCTSCHSIKKVVPANNTKQKDTTHTPKKIIIKDSAIWAKEILDSARNHTLNYRTISGKLGLSIKMYNLDQNINANLRSAKDSLIWISLTGPFNIEGARAKITPDSALVINKLNNTVEKRSFYYIQNLIHQPLAFRDIQNILTGGILLQNATLQSFKGNADGTWNLFLSNGHMQNMVTIDPVNNCILQNFLTDLSKQNRNCTVQYKNFQNTPAGWFPNDISIHVEDKAPIKVELSYKQVNFDQILDYPFNISSKYRIRE